MAESARVNTYACDTCGGQIVTVDCIEGTTPMMLECRATPDCPGTSYSAFYRVSQDLKPEYEWYRPTGEEYDQLSAGMKAHVDMGGLDIRKIESPRVA